ncbi:FliO/MopB family protein [Conexibacter woesei]|uniref:Flagellar biosynthesis protein FliO n=1 Tax=Conexibacter woesei (strain DSM 14684 / CCUG 47730 / CIP 108061 / JCM 11494 / NBRC 100937 / ID131577) TaxID=469383 RepID=D3F418_CONWI|nr:flagellar biosynthetic protein FliO [Conexibacter woesei]ADB48501.1 flagellar biosynthesis protein FliO [Conexibacter woesei DSM 14684]
MIKASLLPRVVALCAALFTVLCTPALAAGGARDAESTPVDLPTTTQPSGDVGGGSGSIVRTIVGLAIVIGVIYGIAWVLRQMKQSKAERSIGGLASVASVALGSGKALHLVRAGNELVLVGVADHGVTPVRTYTEQEAQDAGLIDEWGELILPDGAAEPRARAADAGRGAKVPVPGALVETMRKWTVRR